MAGVFACHFVINYLMLGNQSVANFAVECEKSWIGFAGKKIVDLQILP